MLNILPQDGTLIYHPNFYNQEEADQLFLQLKEEIHWRKDKIKIYGKEHFIPRLTAWYGDPGITYSYSGITMDSTPWTPTLLLIKKKIENHTQKTFNGLLVNFYRNGKDHMSWHADDEVELGENPYISSLSLGETRRFLLKHRTAKDLGTKKIDLEAGSLVIMSEEIQKFWLHRIAPSKKQTDPRINLTFRTIR